VGEHFKAKWGEEGRQQQQPQQHSRGRDCKVEQKGPGKWRGGGGGLGTSWPLAPHWGPLSIFLLLSSTSCCSTSPPPIPQSPNHSDAADADPFSSIGYTMVTLINLGAGLSHYEYAMTCASNYPLTTVFCTIYYLLYITTVVLLLMNLLTGKGGRVYFVVGVF